MKHKKNYTRIYPPLKYTQNYAPNHFIANVYREYLKLHGGEHCSDSVDFFNLNRALRLNAEHSRQARADHFKGIRLSFKRVVGVLDWAVPHVTLEDLIGVKPSQSSKLPKLPRENYRGKSFGMLLARLEDRERWGKGVYILSPSRLSEVTGIAASTLLDYITHRSCPELTNLTLILSALNISLSELLDGEFRGDMVKASRENSLPAPLFVPRGRCKEPVLPYPDMDEWDSMRGKLGKTYYRPFTEEEAQAYKKRAREFKDFNVVGEIDDEPPITPDMF